MTSYPANLGIAHFRRGISFRPMGAIKRIGSKQLGDVTWRSKETWAARLFVGFNVENESRWSVDDLIPLVVAIRQEQGADPSSTILAQKGVYQQQSPAGVVVEDSAQVIIFKVGDESIDEFVAQMVALGERIGAEFQQELVIVEIQKNGVTQETMGVAPDHG